MCWMYVETPELERKCRYSNMNYVQPIKKPIYDTMVYFALYISFVQLQFYW